MLAVAAAVAFIASLALTPSAGWLGRRLGLLDLPDGVRKLHSSPVPKTGGLAVLTAWCIVALGAGVDGVVIAVCSSMAALGLLDDAWDLRPLTKLTAQLAVGTALATTPLVLDVLVVPGLGVFPLGVLAIPVTAVWFAGVVNALNLVDGLDGLTGGLGLVAGGTLAALLAGASPALALAAAALAGALAGFLPTNAHTARIFLGDGGALFVGAVLACISLEAATTLSMPAGVLPLAVPLVDTTLTLLRRAVARQPLLRGDRGHIHHRLLELGLSHGGAVLLLWGVGMLAAAGALAAAVAPVLGTVILGLVGVSAVFTAWRFGYLGESPGRVDLRA